MALRMRIAHYFAHGASRIYDIPNVLFKVLCFFVCVLLLVH